MSAITCRMQPCAQKPCALYQVLTVSSQVKRRRCVPGTDLMASTACSRLLSLMYFSTSGSDSSMTCI